MVVVELGWAAAEFYKEAGGGVALCPAAWKRSLRSHISDAPDSVSKGSVQDC